MAAVDGNQRRGALDLFNVPQARFFNRSLLVELGAQRPIHNIADQTSSDWARTQPWGRRTPTPTADARSRPRTASSAAMRRAWMDPAATCFPQTSHRERSWQRPEHTRSSAHTQLIAQSRPHSAISHASSGLATPQRRPASAAPAARTNAEALAEALRKVREEEQAVREKLVVQDRLAMEAVKARRESERSEGASDVYTPNASLRSASLRLARRGRPSTAPTMARSTRVPNTPNRSTAGMLRAAGSVVPQRGWIV